MATAMLHKAQKDGSPLLLSPDFVVSLLTFLWFYSQKGVFLSLGYTSFISLSQQETDTWKTPKDQIIGKNLEPCVRRVYRYGQETEQTISARPFLATSWAGILFPLCDVLPVFTAKTYFSKEEWAGRVVVVCGKRERLSGCYSEAHRCVSVTSKVIKLT